jgi:hypothetical protein
LVACAMSTRAATKMIVFILKLLNPKQQIRFSSRRKRFNDIIYTCTISSPSIWNSNACNPTHPNQHWQNSSPPAMLSN